MATIRVEDRLDGSSNFNNWKARLMAILEENDIDHYVTNMVEEPSSNAGRTAYKKNQAKARRIVYDSLKENLMLVITPLKIAKECFDTLVKLYETKTPSQTLKWKRIILLTPSRRSPRSEISFLPLE